MRSEISRLLGWPGTASASERRTSAAGWAPSRIKLEAIAVCALLLRKPVRIALTMDEQFYTITKHGAMVNEDRSAPRRAHDCAHRRDALEWRRLRRHRPAGEPEVRIHGRWTI